MISRRDVCSVCFADPLSHLAFLFTSLISTYHLIAADMASPSLTKSNGAAKEVHLMDQPMTMANWYKQIAWLNMIFVAFIPLAGFYMALSTPLLWKTAVWTFIYYFCTGLGITAGTRPALNSWILADKHRLPSTVVSYLLLCISTYPNLSGPCRRRCHPRLDTMVVSKPSRTSPLCRYDEGSLLRATRPSL